MNELTRCYSTPAGATMIVPVAELEQIYVLSIDGGGITFMDLPPVGTNDRDRLDAKIARGELRLLDPDDVETVTTHGSTRYLLKASYGTQ